MNNQKIAVMLAAMVAFLSAPSPGFAQQTFVLPSTSRPAVQVLSPETQSALESQATAELQSEQATVSVPVSKSVGDETFSPMERFFSQAPGLDGEPLRQFGYELFLGGIAGNGLTSEASVPSSYPLGPGDELVLNVPYSTQEIRSIVSREGTIFIPSFGTLSVSGMTIAQFQNAIRARSKGSQVTVRLAKLRTLTVYLAGRVKQPGSYTVGALSTITTLLQAAGGVAKNGSLRNVRLQRGGRTVATFDFYDFLLKGQAAGNVRLEAGDIVFVPSIGSQVGIAGNVRQPAIYELKPGATLMESLELAGGLLAQAYTQRVQLQRIGTTSGREVRTLDLNAPAVAKMKLQDGDLISVAGVLDRLENAVTLSGNVERPGLYEIKPGTRVSQVVGALTELKPESYFEYAQISREVGEDRHLEILPFNLRKALEKDAKNDLVLQPRDKITVYSQSEFRDLPEVEIYGAILRPGKFRLYPNMRLAELINMAGGLKPEADGSNAELTRTQVVDNVTRFARQTFSPVRALAKDDASNLLLAKDDVVLVKSAANYRKTWTLQVSGEVSNPGTYTVLEGETLSSLIERAGGYTRRAYLPGAVFTREAVKVLQRNQLSALADRIEQSIIAATAKDKVNEAALAAQKELVANLRKSQATGRVVVQLDDPAKMRETKNDLQLDNGDTLYIPPVNETVSVLGAVYSPNSLRFDSRMTVGDYLRRAGGATSQGDNDNIYVVRADGQVHSLKNYREGWWIFSRNLMASRLNPGDTIVVPERIDWSNPWVDAATIAQGFGQVLMSGAVLYNTLTK